MTDFEQYKEWNPVMEIEGMLTEGERLELTLTYPNQSPTALRPKVIVVDEPTEFRWQGRLFVPGLYDVEHRFVLAPRDDGTRTYLTHAETFRGVVVGFINRRIGSDIKAGFNQMNEALKHYVEGAGADSAAEGVQGVDME